MTKCPKCGYKRTKIDDPLIPDYQCPSCGIVYEKYHKNTAPITTQSNNAETAYIPKTTQSKITIFLKKILTVALISSTLFIYQCTKNSLETKKREAKEKVISERKLELLKKEAEERKIDAEKKRLALLQDQLLKKQNEEINSRWKSERHNEQKNQEKKLKCEQDARCVSREIINTMAIVECQNKVERFAKYQFKWTDGIFESKFRNFVWKDSSHNSIVGLGHTIEFQNSFGAWQPYLYSCEIRVSDSQILSVEASPGRFP